MAESSSPTKALQSPNSIDSVPSIPRNTSTSNISSPSIASSVTLEIAQMPSSHLTPFNTLEFQQQHQQLQQLKQHCQQQSQLNNLNSSPNFHIQQNLQRSASLSRVTQLQQHQQYGSIRPQQQNQRPIGLYGQMNISTAPISQLQQLQQQQQLGIGISRSGSIDQLVQSSGQLSLPSHSVAVAPINLQTQLLSPMRQKSGIFQGSQFLATNSSGQQMQRWQAMGMMGSLALNGQARVNGALNDSPQRMNLGTACRQQQMPQQMTFTSQDQSLQKPSSAGLPQSIQPAMIQDSLSQQQWLKQMQPPSSSPVSPSYHLQLQQHRRQQQAMLQQQQLSLSPHMQQKSKTLNLQQMSLLQQQQQQLIPECQLHQQQQVAVLQHHEQSPGSSARASNNQQTGSQPSTSGSGTAAAGSSSQEAEVTNQLHGKRKIQDLLLQVGTIGVLEPGVEDLLLEISDNFIDSVTAFACHLAKHRKSTILDSRDLMLHLEKDWHLTVPEFSSRRESEMNHISSEACERRLGLVKSMSGPLAKERSNQSAATSAHFTVEPILQK